MPSRPNTTPRAGSVYDTRGTPPGATKDLGLEMEPQKKLYWCWAAVAVAIHRYYRNRFFSPGAWTQETVAWDICKGCNKPKTLIPPLRTVHHYHPPARKKMPKRTVVKELDAGRPIPIRVEYSTGGGHFVVISGYVVEDDGLDVIIDNPSPLNQDANGRWMPQRKLDFKRWDGFPTWTNSYTTRAAPRP